MTATIGIPLCVDARGRWKRGRTYHYVDDAYARAIESAGGVPIYLPVQAEPARLVDAVDGLLLPGGDDLSPPHAYPAQVKFDLAPEEQLAFDRGLLAAALRKELPVLGICYGMQLLAQHFGATLHYDLASDLPAAKEHRLAEPDGRHEIALVEGSLLARVMGEPTSRVNSLHHQAVAECGPALRASAFADDQVIEAIELGADASHADSFCMGVQWHPEKLPPGPDHAIFRAFVQAAERVRRLRA